jgi:hypothetical protein
LVTAKTTEKEKAGTIDSAMPRGPPMASNSDWREMLGPFSL